MIPPILARQLQQGMKDYFKATYPFANEPFKSSFERFTSDSGSLYLEPYTSIKLPFRSADEMPDVFEAVHPKFLPYVHQQRAFDRLCGDDGQSTVIATGTGSGKTECFLYPILEYCYQHRETRGIKALIIYPMNALASDQASRIARLIFESRELKGNVSVGLYVGGLGHGGQRVMSEDGVITDRQTMQNNPPDILLTNYKMLDYLLIRPGDSHIWDCDRTSPLKYIAVDELHTFDGAQGTDLACLLRRLKSRLRIPRGSLCCIGTSATLGGSSAATGILKYASDIFGEPFADDAVVTEDRLTPEEFFDGYDRETDAYLDVASAAGLREAAGRNDADGYLESAAVSCLEYYGTDSISSSTTRLAIADSLMRNALFQDILTLSQGRFFQPSELAKRLETRHPWLMGLEKPGVAIEAMVALVSHARSGDGTRPFLNVQTQLWMRELARFVGKVDSDEVAFDISINLNESQRNHYLPLHNCRDCGQTAWIAPINRSQRLKAGNLDAFYNDYFGSGENIVSVYPRNVDDNPSGKLHMAWLCPECLHVEFESESGHHSKERTCAECGVKSMPVFVSELTVSSRTGATSSASRQYECPHCGSNQGLSLIGLRATTEAEVGLTQMFASKFDGDDKALVFSDNVQDASHRAGFFNGRTWRFGLRSAMVDYLSSTGGSVSFVDFLNGFPAHFESSMSKEDFVARFIAPNNVWMSAYEEMKTSGTLAKGDDSRKLLSNIKNRMRYEVLLEFGIRSTVGRTLEKSGVAAVYFDEELVDSAADIASELVRNEAGYSECDERGLKLLVLLIIHEMRRQGAITDQVYEKFVSSNANSYYLSNRYTHFLPGWHASTTPKFLTISSVARRGFCYPSSTCFTHLVAKVFPDVLDFALISHAVLSACERAGVLSRFESDSKEAVFGLAKDAMGITGECTRFVCDTCGTQVVFASQFVGLIEGSPCLSGPCNGHMCIAHNQGADYYGDLFNKGALERIRAEEHTGLLTREERESVEREFKSDGDSARPWYPNVLSCTPTLEMGIDIGDLSALVLCGMPPGQAQFLQRVGRAGRRDGNAFALVLANASPHGMYFYASPEEMIQGEIEPPRVFLHAAAVLERQFTAFCLDSWVSDMGDKALVPDNVYPCIQAMAPGKQDSGKFPFNFMNYVKSRQRQLVNVFLDMFSIDLRGDTDTVDAVRAFALGEPGSRGIETPMHMRLHKVFEDRYLLREFYKAQKKELDAIVKDLESKPSDSSFEEQIKEHKYELQAVNEVIKSINHEDVFGLLSRESLLPNYAFPEEGIKLRTIIRKKQLEPDETGKGKWQKTTHEYSRSASAGLADFAPSNTFYASGRHFEIDQIDMSTSDAELWRLCPNCSHAEKVIPGTPASTCPRCGTPAWADSGQVRKMLRLRTVVANVDDRESRTDDASDQRIREFFSRQLLVEVDEDKDVVRAYRISGPNMDFGFDYVRKATLREINYGRSSNALGHESLVAGDARIRAGFKVCSECGKIERTVRGKSAISHSYSCPVKRGTMQEEDAIEDCLFIYREFESEALRILIPETTFVSEEASIVETFVAAIMLGMKRQFGNVDHLLATVQDEPIESSGYRKRYLVIYDSVPGGTGYLKQLASSGEAFLDVLRLAKEAVDTCSCNDDPAKDGCYHCLFEHRQSKNIGSISRTRAQGILSEILDPANELTNVSSVSNVPINTLLDSELEKKFVEALSKISLPTGEKAKVTKELVHEKPGYRLVVGDFEWEVEPQVDLGPDTGVAVRQRPDFVFYPVVGRDEEAPWLPVAVYTDGFEYHKSIVADDTLKRGAASMSGKYRVWALSWNDVEGVFTPQGQDYMLNCLKIPELPREDAYSAVLSMHYVGDFVPYKLTPFEKLVWYLTHRDAESSFRAQARAYGVGMLALAGDVETFNRCVEEIADIAEGVRGERTTFQVGNSIVNAWSPSGAEHLTLLAGTSYEHMRATSSAELVFAVINDTNFGDAGFKREWNGFLDLCNVMQFFGGFAAVSRLGLQGSVYAPLYEQQNEPLITSVDSGGWTEVVADLLDEESVSFAMRLSDLGIQAPSVVGYELENGEMAEMAWESKRVCYLMAAQLEDAPTFEAEGWVVISDSSGNDELARFLGE